jgi:hypothetical protein
MTKETKALKDLTLAVSTFMLVFDKIMKEKESFERGKKIAIAINNLDFSNDYALHFGLGYSFKKMQRMAWQKNKIYK